MWRFLILGGALFSMKNTIVYPGTFDPMTYGHVDVVERAIKIFDRVIVAVAVNTNKKPLFSLEERVVLAKQVLANHKHTEVYGFECLLTDFMHEHGAKVILRGLRAVSDFDYEFQLAGMNRSVAPDIESLFLTPAMQHTYVSSSFIKEIAMFGGDVTEFAPPIVVAALKKKF